MMGRFRKEVIVYKLFSAVVTQDVIVEGAVVAGGLISKKRNPQGAKLFNTDLLCGVWCCDFGLLYEKLRLDAGEKVGLLKEGRSGRLDLNENVLAGSHNWDHSLCFI